MYLWQRSGRNVLCDRTWSDLESDLENSPIWREKNQSTLVKKCHVNRAMIIRGSSGPSAYGFGNLSGSILGLLYGSSPCICNLSSCFFDALFNSGRFCYDLLRRVDNRLDHGLHSSRNQAQTNSGRLCRRISNCMHSTVELASYGRQNICCLTNRRLSDLLKQERSHKM